MPQIVPEEIWGFLVVLLLLQHESVQWAISLNGQMNVGLPPDYLVTGGSHKSAIVQWSLRWWLTPAATELQAEVKAASLLASTGPPSWTCDKKPWLKIRNLKFKIRMWATLHFHRYFCWHTASYINLLRISCISCAPMKELWDFIRFYIDIYIYNLIKCIE